MMKNKKMITIVIVSITIVLLIVLTLIFKPRLKSAGSYTDTLESSSITTRIVTTNLVKEDTKTMIEVVTSIWNRGNNDLVITNNNFSYNTTTPTNKINYKIGKNERVSIRQVYEYIGPVQKYNVNVDNTTFAFDFTLKNTELSQKNVELSQSSTNESLKETLDKAEKDALNEREKVVNKITEDNEKVAKEAEKEASEQKVSIFGKYISRNVGDETIIRINSDYSASLHIACGVPTVDRYINKLTLSSENNVHTLEGSYQDGNVTRNIKMTIKDKELKVVESDEKCLLEVSYSKS